MGQIQSVVIDNKETECELIETYEPTEINICTIDSSTAFPYTAKLEVDSNLVMIQAKVSIKYDDPLIPDSEGVITPSWSEQTSDMIKLSTNEEKVNTFETEFTFDEPGYYYFSYLVGDGSWEGRWVTSINNIQLRAIEGRNEGGGNSMMWWIIGGIIGLIILIILIVILVIVLNKSKKKSIETEVETEPLVEPIAT